MLVKELSEEEVTLVSGGAVFLIPVAVKAFFWGVAAAGAVLAVEDLSGASGHNHYGK